MPKKIEVTVYTFKELLELKNEKAIERAREKLREWATSHDWYEYTYEEWKKILEAIGFTSPEIQFSGFWSQGDGASFTSGVDVAKVLSFMTTEFTPTEGVMGETERDWLNYVCHELRESYYDIRYAELNNPELLDYLGASVERTSHHYSHSNTCSVEGDDRIWSYCDNNELPEERRTHLERLFGEFIKDMEKLRKSLSELIYKALEADYEGRTSDEALIEDSEANEYEFEEDGSVR